MSTISTINTAGQAALAYNVLTQKKTQVNALKFIDVVAEEGIVSEKSKRAVRRSYLSTYILQLIPSLCFIVMIAAGLPMIDGAHPEIGGALILIGLPLFMGWIIASSIFTKHNTWNEYYRWYKKATKMSDLKKIFPETEAINFETPEDTSKLTSEQIAARKEARAAYLEKQGLPPKDASEEDTDRRIKRQMKAAGYTDEQISKIFEKGADH